jgi:hypothetical protein
LLVVAFTLELIRHSEQQLRAPAFEPLVGKDLGRDECEHIVGRRLSLQVLATLVKPVEVLDIGANSDQS